MIFLTLCPCLLVHGRSATLADWAHALPNLYLWSFRALPPEVYLSKEIVDFPAGEIYSTLTPDQKGAFLAYKFFWAEAYAALARYFCGEPVIPIDWVQEGGASQNFIDYLSTTVESLLALYGVLNFGWAELSRQLPDCPETPGQLFQALLRNRALSELMPMLEGDSFSPQGRYRQRQKLMKGEGEPSATDGQVFAMSLENKAIQLLKRTKNQQVIRERKRYLAAVADLQRLQLKAAHDRSEFLMYQRF